MNYETTESFMKDLSSIKDKAILNKFKKYLNLIEDAEKLTDLSNIIKLKGFEDCFSLRLGDYRIGFS